MAFRSSNGKRWSVTARRILASPVQRLAERLRPLALSEAKPFVAKAAMPVKNLGCNFLGMYELATACTRVAIFCMVGIVRFLCLF